MFLSFNTLADSIGLKDIEVMLDQLPILDGDDLALTSSTILSCREGTE
jgi:hypothetical protein